MGLPKYSRRLPLDALKLVLVLQFLCCASKHNIPESPCPGIFQYEFDGNEYYGMLRLTDFPMGETVQINVVLTLREMLRSSYPGSLDLYNPSDQTLQNVVTNKAILYKILFPVQNVLPRVVQIFVNNQIICSGTPDGGPVVTNIKLEHTLQTQVSQSLSVESTVPSTTSKQSPPPASPPRMKPLAPQITSNIRPQNPSQAQPETQYPTEDVGNNLQDVNKICGTIDSKFNVRALVVGGEEIARGSWPWLVAIYFNLPTSLAFQCGGSLISKKIVLTSAHCFFGGSKQRKAQDVVVFLGRYNIRNWNETGSVAAPADGVYVHPDYNYNKQTFDADIALVLLKSDVSFSSLIRPVCLWPTPSTTADIEGSRGVVVGWGRNEAGQSTNSVPKKVETTIVSDLDCIRSNEQFRILTSNRTFCAGDRDGNGPCTGDSGGGLMLRRDNKWWLRGTVSASLADSERSTCDLNEYVIFVDVSKFLSWIKSYMQI